MSLFIKGKWFYGEFLLHGRRLRLALNVKVDGIVPKPLQLPGDPVFENRRIQALAAYQKLKTELTDPSRSVKRLEQIEELATGNKTRTITPGELFEIWVSAPRKKPLQSKRRIDEVKKLLSDFSAFLKKSYPQVHEIRQVNFEVATKFMRLGTDDLAPKTVNNRLITMRAVFKAAGDHVTLKVNPFKKIPLLEVDTISRTPFTQEELEKILSVAKKDQEIGGVVVAAACSGMRRNDCATLRWTKVDLAAGFVTTVTEKTAKEIVIPILPPLRRFLEKLESREGFCFPAAAELAIKNPDGLNWRLKKLLEKAGVDTKAHPLREGQKRKRIQTESGFHRFKATFVSLALDAGVPVPLIQKIVGNTDARVLLAHYHRPSKDVLSTLLTQKLPGFLGGSHTLPVLQTIKKLVTGMKPGNWKKVRAEILSVIDAPQ